MSNIYTASRVSRLRIILLVGFLFCLSHPGLAQEQATLVQPLDADAKRFTLESRKPFEDVIMDLEFAISQFNYRLTGRNRVGSAIASMENRPYPKSTVLHFCNIQAAKEIIEINPLFLLHMPCRITVREQGTASVIIDARLVPENDPAMHEVALRVNKMMRDIVIFGADE